MALADTFASILVLSFGFFILLAGLFTAYFGAGKSRKIGLALTMVGVLALVVFTSLVTNLFGQDAVVWDREMVIQGIVAVIAATVGAMVAMTMFLVSIMRA
ncbi:MAG TPA: hypothetical protein VM889_02400 [Candidatus Thermoplasmatota archaeon]|nr:hypothetical protein [Candidatus Thermoplasmatota archaeon]